MVNIVNFVLLNESAMKLVNKFVEVTNNEVLAPYIVNKIVLGGVFLFIWLFWCFIISGALSFVGYILGINLDDLKWELCVPVGLSIAGIAVKILDMILTFESLGVHI